MATFVVHPITREMAAQARHVRQSPQYGHPIHQELARGTGPCRQCLRAFNVGTQDRILFTYSPFDGASSLRQPGPIFIHADECVSHDGTGYPDGLRGIPTVMQAYYGDGTIAEPRPLAAGDESSLLSALFDEPSVRFAHLRHAEAGCFIARVERAESERI
jgi:hypothetical protein